MHETATFLLSCPHVHRLKNFSDRLSNKPFLMWLLTVPPNLKYVANVPCNLSSIACFLTSMYHKVVWQHMQRVAGSLITALLQIYPRIFQWKKKKIYSDLTEWWPWVWCAVFFGPPCKPTWMACMSSYSWSTLDAPRTTQWTPSFFRHQAVYQSHT